MKKNLCTYTHIITCFREGREEQGMKLSKNAYSTEFNRAVERENFEIP